MILTNLGQIWRLNCHLFRKLNLYTFYNENYEFLIHLIYKI